MIDCPYCGESITVLIDLSAGDQSYVEDCAVCCRPMVIETGIEGGDIVSLQAKREDD